MIKKIQFIGIVFLCYAALASENVETIKEHFGTDRSSANWNANADMNDDGVIDGDDVSQLIVRSSKDKKLQAGHYFRDHVLVRFTDKLSTQTIANTIQELNSRRLDVKFKSTSGYSKITVPDNIAIFDFVNQLKSHTNVVNAQLDYICRITSDPNDPYYHYQWNFHQLDAPKAWLLSGGGQKGIVVAILDTGIAYEDYSDYKRAPDFAGTNFVSGYDFVNADNHANDDEGHGTHVAGTVAQATHNNEGVAGLAYECSLMPVKIMGANGTGSAYNLAEGIRWAVDNGADVINMSLGFNNCANPGSIVGDAVKYAYYRDVICVAASGNNATSAGYAGCVEYPAAYDECVAVGAIRYDKTRAYYSNWGSNLTCVAPGGDMRVDQNHDSYGDGILQQTIWGSGYTKFEYVFYQGTSMASPHVAAAAALFKSRRGGGSTEFFAALAETCSDLGSSGYDSKYGYGLVNIVDLIRKGSGWGANN